MTDDKNDIKKIKVEFLTQLWDDYKYSINKFDNQSLYISSGALGLSLAFIKDIVPIQEIIFEILYFIAISLFAIALLVGFLAHLRSASLIKGKIDDINNDTIDDIETERRKDKIIPRYNKWLVGLIFAGVLFLIVFAMINITSYKKKINENMINETQNVSVIRIDNSANKDSMSIDTVKN